jgi:hypothetical protein
MKKKHSAVNRAVCSGATKPSVDPVCTPSIMLSLNGTATTIHTTLEAIASQCETIADKLLGQLPGPKEDGPTSYSLMTKLSESKDLAQAINEFLADVIDQL